MVSIEIKGADELSAKFKNFAGQVAFATANAINSTAKIVQTHEIEKQLPGKLTLRSRGSPWTKPGTKFGVNIKPFATKAKPIAIIGSQADWLRLQESGGIKSVSGHRIAVPTRFWKDPKAIMQRRLKPKAILGTATTRPKSPDSSGPASKPRVKTGKPRAKRSQSVPAPGIGGRAWIYDEERGTKMPPGIYARTSGPRLPIRMLFRLLPSARINEVLEFFESGRAKVIASYQPEFEREIARALSTARLA